MTYTDSTYIVDAPLTDQDIQDVCNGIELVLHRIGVPANVINRCVNVTVGSPLKTPGHAIKT